MAKVLIGNVKPTLINNLTTQTAGQGALDAACGYELDTKVSQNDVEIRNLITTQREEITSDINNAVQALDTLEGILDNTEAGKLVGALGIKELVDAVPTAQGTYSGSLANMATGLWRVNLSTASDTPETSGNAIVMCYKYAVQLMYVYNSTTVTKIYARTGAVSDGTGAYHDWKLLHGKGTLTTDGLSARESRCTIASGGYCVMGDMCYFQLQLKLATALTGPNYWALIDGMPKPMTRTAVSVSTDGAGGAARFSTVDLSTDSSSGSLIIRNSAGMSSGDVLNFSGYYMTA